MSTGDKGTTDGSSTEAPNIGDNEAPYIVDGDIDKGKRMEKNGASTEKDKWPQEMPNDLSKQQQLNAHKEVIILDDDVDDDEKNAKNQLSGDHQINGGNKDPPEVGMVFTTYDDVTNFFKQYALRIGFGVAVKKSSFSKKGVCRRLILVCSRGGKGRRDACYQARQTAKTNCEVMISVKLWGDGLLHLVEAKLEHNHPVSPSTARFMRCYKRMAESNAVDLVEQPGGDTKETECENTTEIGRLKFVEGDNEAIQQIFTHMQNKNPNFFYSVDLDEDGRLKNLFLADARSREAYQYFGDVVTFDTSCLAEKYDLPLISFVGMNHHGQLVLLGCGLISDETVETYTWLFKSWLTSMLECPPNAIITDHCKSIQAAVAKVFPGAKHRFCLSYILKKVPEKFRGFTELKAVKKALKKMAYDSLRPQNFEENWKKMIEAYGLEGNEWLTSLYEDQHSWVPGFLKGAFWAGMSISKRGESLSTFFDGYVFPRTSLKQFFSKFEMTLQNKMKKEVQADSESLHKTPLIRSKFYMEEQVSKVYTLNMFKKFQDELKATMYCDVAPTKIDGSNVTFEVKECSYMEEGKRTENKDYEVLFNQEELKVDCICGFFELNGILCRHALSVFKFQQIFELPPRYIHDRWRKDFKRLRALARASNDVVATNTSERYDYLSMRFLQLVDIGFISEDRYQLSLKLLREVEKSLLDDPIGRDRQPKLLSFESHANKNAQSLYIPQLGFSEDNRTSDSLPVKRRGRPPKKGRESNVEPLVRTNKEQDFLSSALITNGDNVLQDTSTVSHLDTHIGLGGIDLMEEVNPNDLSFGTHFGLHVNQQNHMSNQPRMQQTNLLQGPYEQPTIGNQGMQWFYQNILQDDQIPKAPSRNG
ncbi:protein FAR1-RELATED SEQUENCE 6-like isoform X1 [Iris pallida]|uniref:Protein FAR1-RELATED SEQUENCE n=1 Tax=Iris pallida TaxID=29817 RepID=A0AAX6EEK4_IRIPA|nr:protein FAR1-RELATED SEQUENCE 6-like isoform X1 [Iris pallida]